MDKKVNEKKLLHETKQQSRKLDLLLALRFTIRDYFKLILQYLEAFQLTV